MQRARFQKQRRADGREHAWREAKTKAIAARTRLWTRWIGGKPQESFEQPMRYYLFRFFRSQAVGNTRLMLLVDAKKSKKSNSTLQPRTRLCVTAARPSPPKSASEREVLPFPRHGLVVVVVRGCAAPAQTLNPALVPFWSMRHGWSDVDRFRLLREE